MDAVDPWIAHQARLALPLAFEISAIVFGDERPSYTLVIPISFEMTLWIMNKIRIRLGRAVIQVTLPRKPCPEGTL